MTELDATTVAAAHDAWAQAPNQAQVVETAEYQLIRLPDRFPDPLRVPWVRSTRPAEVVLAEVLAEAATFALPELVVCVKPSAPADLGAALLDRGAELIDTADVLALRLPLDDPTPAIPDVEVRWRDTLPVARDASTVAIAVFGGDPPTPTHLDAALDRDRELRAAGAGGAVVAYLDGEPVGVAGLEIVDSVARLWGGGVLADRRGRGGYRALLATRLAYAAERGATMALTQARVSSSSPILRRYGFDGYGQEHTYRLRLDRS